MPLRPAQIHPHQHLGEVGRVHPAGLRTDGHQRLALVVLAGQQGAHLLGVDLLLHGDQLFLRLHQRVRVVVTQLEQHIEVVQALPELLDVPELGLRVGELAGDLLGVFLVVPEVRDAGRFGKLGDGDLELVDVHDGLDARQGGFQGLHCCRVVKIHKWSAYAVSGSGLAGSILCQSRDGARGVVAESAKLTSEPPSVTGGHRRAVGLDGRRGLTAEC